MSRGEINIDRLIKIANNDEAFIRSMLSLFIDRTPGLVNQMLEACKKNDYRQAISLAHQLKPSVDMIGDKHTSKLLLDIYETTESRSNCDDSLMLISTFSSKIKELVGLIAEKLKQESLI